MSPSRLVVQVSAFQLERFQSCAISAKRLVCLFLPRGGAGQASECAVQHLAGRCGGELGGCSVPPQLTSSTDYRYAAVCA